MADTNDTLAATMKRIDANERTFRVGLFAAAAIEAVALAAFLLLTDFRDRTQVLLLLMFASMLSIAAMAGVAIASFGNRQALRVLRSVELLRAERSGPAR
jgi:cobalamin synthase